MTVSPILTDVSRPRLWRLPFDPHQSGKTWHRLALTKCLLWGIECEFVVANARDERPTMIPTMRREAAARVVALVLLAGLGSSLAAAVAHAADFGGECCAELEERVADFEATTVRRGNEKVSIR